MDTFDDTFSPLPEETTPLEEPPVQEAGTAPEEAIPEEAVPEDAAPEAPRSPRSPYEDSPYESFYGTHEQPQPQPRKPRPKLPPFWGTVALVAAGCLLTGLITASAARKQTAEQTAYLYDRIARLETRLAALGNTGGNASTPLPAGEVLPPAQVYAQNVGSVVGISCEAAATVSGQTLRRSVTGSGFLVTSDGYIVTNYHVIKGAQQITVTANDGSTYAATLVGTDEDNDIAVLKVDAKDLTPAILGDSDTLKVGDAVLAIGNPLGTLSGTVTDGIVSALERQVTIDGNNMTLLQTSAAVNPGNSGGGLFNASGELIGIVNAKSTSDSSGNAVDNIGFAIPINSVKTIIEDLISHGYVTGQIVLGVSLVDITDERTARYYGLDSTGVYIQSVESGSIADKGGLQAGDRLLSFGGVEVSTADELKAALASHSVGDRVEIKVSRNGREYTHSVVLTEYVPSSATN